jgi:quercetin dioxygenase-like cupin family protein
MNVMHDEAKGFTMAKGIESKIMGCGGSIMMVENTFDKGGHAPLHDHIHEQAGYIAEGSFEFIIGEETVVFKKGDSFYIPSQIPHGCTALEDGIVVDVFSPIREDFLEKVK